MRINNINKTNFNGYKNVIHNDFSFPEGRFMFMSVQLNNEDGIEDLKALNTIQRIQGMEQPSDVMNIFYSKKPAQKNFFFFNGKPLFLGYELRSLWEHRDQIENYKTEENAALKAYTLIASLTRRMMYNGLSQKDRSYPKVVQSAMETYMKIFTTNPASIFNLIQHSIIENKSVERTAEAFNRLVDRNMKIFFK